MSEIDKAFSEYIKQVKKDYPQELIDKSAAKADFIAGAEFKQKEYEEKLRWIPIEEDLPPRLGEFHLNEFSISVLIKSEEIVSYGFYHFTTGKLESEVSGHEYYEFTHWRPISFL